MFKLFQSGYQYLTLTMIKHFSVFIFYNSELRVHIKTNFLIHHLILETADDNTTHRQNVILNSVVLITLSLFMICYSIYYHENRNI